MMRSTLALALSALAVNTVAAVPLDARGYVDGGVVWHTVTQQVVETVDVYTTIWVKPTPAVVTEYEVAHATTTKTAGGAGGQHHQHHHGHTHKSKSKPKSKTTHASVAPPAQTPQTYAPAPAPSSSPAEQPESVYVPAPPAPATTAKASPSSKAPAPAPVPTTSSVVAPAPQPEPTTQAPVQQPTTPAQQYTQEAPAPSPVAPSSSKVETPAQQPSSQPESSQSTSGSSLFQGYTEKLPGATTGFDCGDSCEGDMTFYNPSVGMGACGGKDGTDQIWTDEDDVVAVAVNMMGTLSSGDVMNPFCNKKIKITNPHNGKTATGTVVDKCFGCAGNQDIDLSPHLYDQLAAAGDGRIEGVKWEWMQ